MCTRFSVTIWVRLRLCLFCAVCACFSWGKRSCLIVFVPDSQEAAMRHLLVGASGQGHWLRFAWVQANPRSRPPYPARRVRAAPLPLNLKGRLLRLNVACASALQKVLQPTRVALTPRLREGYPAPLVSFHGRENYESVTV